MTIFGDRNTDCTYNYYTIVLTKCTQVLRIPVTVLYVFIMQSCRCLKGRYLLTTDVIRLKS